MIIRWSQDAVEGLAATTRAHGKAVSEEEFEREGARLRGDEEAPKPIARAKPRTRHPVRRKRKGITR